jgi:hypothetical protein
MADLVPFVSESPILKWGRAWNYCSLLSESAVGRNSAGTLHGPCPCKWATGRDGQVTLSIQRSAFQHGTEVAVIEQASRIALLTVLVERL